MWACGSARLSSLARSPTPFTITFNNEDDGIPHNVQIFEGEDTTGTPVFAPGGDELITGPDTAVYEVPALAAGTFQHNPPPPGGAPPPPPPRRDQEGARFCPGSATLPPLR